jgi:hypothetical protein
LIRFDWLQPPTVNAAALTHFERKCQVLIASLLLSICDSAINHFGVNGKLGPPLAVLEGLVIGQTVTKASRLALTAKHIEISSNNPQLARQWKVLPRWLECVATSSHERPANTGLANASVRRDRNGIERSWIYLETALTEGCCFAKSGVP